MAIKVGQFLSRSGTGLQDVPLAFDPAAVIVWSNLVGLNSVTGYWYYHDGVCTNALQVARGSSDSDGAATSDTNAHYVEGQTISARNNAGTLEMEAAMTLGVGKFTLNWTTNVFANTGYNYLAVGGSGVEAELLSRDKGVGNSGADEIVTGLTIGRPTCVIALPTYTTAAQPTSDNSDVGAAIPSWGWSDGTRQGCAGVMIEDGQATMDTWRYQRNDRFFQHLNTGNGTIRFMSHIVGFGNGQFTYNWDAVDALSNLKLYFLALKGIAAHAFSFTQAASVGAQAITGVPFRPEAAMLMSTYLQAQAGATPINTASLADARFMLGAVDPSTQVCLTTGSTDNVPNTINARTNTNAYCIRVVLETDPGEDSTTLASASRTAFTDDGLTLDWDVNDGTPRQYLGLALGTAVTPPIDWLPRSQTAQGQARGGGVPSGMAPPEAA